MSVASRQVKNSPNLTPPFKLGILSKTKIMEDILAIFQFGEPNFQCLIGIWFIKERCCLLLVVAKFKNRQFVLPSKMIVSLHLPIDFFPALDFNSGTIFCWSQASIGG